MENQRWKRKRVKRRIYIAKGGVLLGVEGASRAQAAREGSAEGVAETATERPQRVVRKCSICKLTGYNARRCPRR